MHLHMIRGTWIAIEEDKTERSDTVHKSGENITGRIYIPVQLSIFICFEPLLGMLLEPFIDGLKCLCTQLHP